MPDERLSRVRAVPRKPPARDALDAVLDEVERPLAALALPPSATHETYTIAPAPPFGMAIFYK